MKTACVFIDIQNDYFPGGANELFQAEEAGVCAGKLLAFAREYHIPVIHVQHVSLHPGATFFLPDTRGVDIHQSVTPSPGEPIVRKHFPNSFRETDLKNILTGMGIERLIIAGMMTHMCIDTTVRAAFDLGYTCVLASDACATKNLSWNGWDVSAADVQSAYLASLSGLFTEVLSTREILERDLS